MVDTGTGSNGNHDQIRLVAEAMAESMAVKFSEKPEKPSLDLSPTEKGIGAVITAVVISMLAWTVYTTNETAKEVAVIKSQLEVASSDRYTGSEARQHEREMERRISALESLHRRE